jgi:Holliday junction resolvase
MLAKRKGYRVERKIRMFFEKNGWKVVRAGASLGEADLICFKNEKCLFLQIKSTKKKTIYYHGYMNDTIEGFPFYLVVDFGYNKIRILKPKHKAAIDEGMRLDEFLQKFKV